MTREKLLERIAQLKSEQSNLRANIDAFTGAIQDCEYWLRELEAAESKKEE